MGSFVINCKAKEIGKQLMEHLRKILISSIEINGRESDVTIKLSQELDKLVVAEQRKVIVYGN